jgi:predicted RNA-binding Zn-ribbon protein involved in translation (DUF1610 family)
MRIGWVGATFLVMACMATAAQAYQCNNRYYLNRSGHVVHSPSCGSEHLRRAAICRDGSVSYSEHHSGTCSHHGGVAQWR